MEDKIYYVKTTIDGVVVSIQTFNFEPEVLDENTTLISQSEYEELLYQINNNPSLTPFPEKILLPYWTYNRFRVVFSSSVSRYGKTILVPIESTNIIFYEYNTIYFNGFYNKNTNEDGSISGKINGLVKIYDESEDKSINIDESENVYIIISNKKYSFECVERGIKCTISLVSPITDDTEEAHTMYFLFKAPVVEEENTEV